MEGIQEESQEDEGRVIATFTIESSEGHDCRIGHVVPIWAKDSIFVGRDKETCELSFDSVFISRLHFRIYTIAVGVDTDSQSPTHLPLVYCEDRMSSNGTYVNDTLIGNHRSPRNPYLLSDGDIVTIRPHWKFHFRQHLPPTDSFTRIQLHEMSIFDELFKVSSRILGSGQYGTVFAASDVTTQKQLACKIVDLNGACAMMDPQMSQQKLKNKRNAVFKEVEMLKQISHPNIISLYKAYHSAQNLYIFSELAPGGDLLSFIEANGGILEDLPACTVFHQVAIAVDHLHSCGIAHRDLKMENILVMRNEAGSRVVLSDFGAAKVFRTPENKTTRMMSIVGTHDYLAPEFWQKPKYETERGYTEATDLWAMGKVAICALSGAMFFSPDEMPLLDQAGVDTQLEMSNQPQRIQKAWAAVSGDARGFVKKLMVVDVTRRITAKQALAHEWFQKPNGRDMELHRLHERTSATWIKRTSAINVIEPLPDPTTNNVTRTLKKLPDSTASPYFSLDRHLHDKSISRLQVRKNRKLILESVKDSGSAFVTNRLNNLKKVHRVPSLKTVNKLPRHHKSSPTVLESQSSLEFPAKFHKMQPLLLKPSLKSSTRYGLDEILTIPIMNANDMFGTAPIEIKAAWQAEAAMDEYSQPRSSKFQDIDYDDLAKRSPDFESFLSRKLGPEDFSSSTTIPQLHQSWSKERAAQKWLATNHSDVLTDELQREDNLSELGDVDIDYGYRQYFDNSCHSNSDSKYLPEDEENQIAALGHHVTEDRSNSIVEARQQQDVQSFPIDQEIYEEAWDELPKSRFITAKALGERVIAVRKLQCGPIVAEDTRDQQALHTE